MRRLRMRSNGAVTVMDTLARHDIKAEQWRTLASTRHSEAIRGLRFAGLLWAVVIGVALAAIVTETIWLKMIAVVLPFPLSPGLWYGIKDNLKDLEQSKIWRGWARDIAAANCAKEVNLRVKARRWGRAR